MKSSTASASARNQNPHGDGRYIPMLDGWRAVAIIFVLLFHGIIGSNLHGNPRLLALADQLGRAGALGVLIFFCISGFLITQRLLAETGENGTFSLRAFYIKRIFRILPPLILYLLVIVALHLGDVIELQARDWFVPLFLNNYFSGSNFTAQFWSLSLEEHFYLFWPICAFYLGWRRAMWIGIGIVCAVAVWRPWVLSHALSQGAALRRTDVRVDFIMMGAVVAIAVETYPWVRPFLRKVGSGTGLIVMFSLFLLSLLYNRADLRSVQAILLTLIVAGSAITGERHLGRILTNQPVLFLGKISYSLYVWQQVFLVPNQNRFWGSLSALPVRYAAALLTAYVSYRFVELPFIRYGRSLLPQKKAPKKASINPGASDLSSA